MKEVGFLVPEEPTQEPGRVAALEAILDGVGEKAPKTASKERCPRCSEPGLIRGEGCATCPHCGWSKCS